MAKNHLRGCFRPSDRLALLLINKKTRSVIQHLASVETIAAADFLRRLVEKNEIGFDVYLSGNALKPDAKGRTKPEILAIRNIYLDFDRNGTESVQQLLKRPEIPVPRVLVNTSPGKCQVYWQVEEFGKEQAENLQRILARQTGADPAATDCARVLRLPGFYNHKYADPYLVRLSFNATRTGAVYGPQNFSKVLGQGLAASDQAVNERPKTARRTGGSSLSQSERDWAYAKRALARGDPQQLVIAAIATYRRFDKYDPHYYAELTVRKAAEHLAVERTRDGGPER